MKKIVVIGSLNVDIVSQIARLPQQGETLAVTEMSQNLGGKGANQAVAAARQGADVSFIGAVGNDDNGLAFKELFKQEGIDTTYLYTKNQPTGTAMILLESDGHNTILVHGGANMRLTTDDILKAENVIKEADVVVAQLEVPADVITAGFKLAKKYGAITMLNPAPVTSHLPQEMIQYIDLLLPNETEAAALAQQNPTTDIEVIEKHAYPVFVELGFTNTIITLGAQGSYYHVGSYAGHVPIFPAEVVDTTAAGDTFIGNLAVHLNVDMGNVQSAVEWSSMASALAVSREGAIKSIPTKREIENTFKQYEVTP